MMSEERSNQRLAYLVTFAVFFTFLGMATTTPALNTGDYVRTLETMSLDVGLWTIPDECMPYNDAAPEPPRSTLAVFGMLFSQADRLLGHDCMHHERWFMVLSLIYWLGAYVALQRENGASFAGKLFLLSFSYFLFSGYFYSFYQEALLIALSPWMFVALQAPRPRLIPMAVMLAVVMFAKTQVILFVPVLLLWVLMAQRRSPSLNRTGLVILVMASVAWITMASNNFNVAQNAYNRIFNGIGWTLLNAQDWPETEFDARHTYFYENEAQFTEEAGQACAPDHLNIMGTTFWPTGDEIWNEVRTSATPEADAEFVKTLGFSNYVDCLVETGQPLRYLSTIYRMFFTSDYAVGYAIKHGGEGSFLELVNAVRSLFLRYLAPIAGTVMLGYVLATRSATLALSAGYVFFVTPLLIVVADGFFEFEKHMVLSFAFLLGPVLLGAPRDRVGVEQETDAEDEGRAATVSAHS